MLSSRNLSEINIKTLRKKLKIFYHHFIKNRQKAYFLQQFKNTHVFLILEIDVLMLKSVKIILVLYIFHELFADCKINCHKKCQESLPNNCQGEARGASSEGHLLFFTIFSQFKF